MVRAGSSEDVRISVLGAPGLIPIVVRQVALARKGEDPGGGALGAGAS
jgi:hypothetical protein